MEEPIFKPGRYASIHAIPTAPPAPREEASVSTCEHLLTYTSVGLCKITHLRKLETSVKTKSYPLAVH